MNYCPSSKIISYFGFLRYIEFAIYASSRYILHYIVSRCIEKKNYAPRKAKMANNFGTEGVCFNCQSRIFISKIFYDFYLIKDPRIYLLVKGHVT